MKIPAAVRRARLAQLIDERYKSQADFVAKTGENQGEVSALLKNKSFGEKKARSIEVKCGLPAGWLDIDVPNVPSGASTTGSGRSENVSRNKQEGPTDLHQALLDQAKLLMLFWSADDIGRGNILDYAANEVDHESASTDALDSTRNKA